MNPIKMTDYFFGVEVTGECRTKNLEMVKSLGADHVIDYTKEDFTKNGQTYDVIFDTVGKRSFSRCKGSLTTNGTYLSPVLSLPKCRYLITGCFIAIVIHLHTKKT